MLSPFWVWNSLGASHRTLYTLYSVLWRQPSAQTIEIIYRIEGTSSWKKWNIIKNQFDFCMRSLPCEMTHAGSSIQQLTIRWPSLHIFQAFRVIWKKEKLNTSGARNWMSDVTRSSFYPIYDFYDWDCPKKCTDSTNFSFPPLKKSQIIESPINDSFNRNSPNSYRTVIAPSTHQLSCL